MFAERARREKPRSICGRVVLHLAVWRSGLASALNYQEGKTQLNDLMSAGKDSDIVPRRLVDNINIDKAYQY